MCVELDATFLSYASRSMCLSSDAFAWEETALSPVFCETVRAKRPGDVSYETINGADFRSSERRRLASLHLRHGSSEEIAAPPVQPQPFATGP